MKMSLRRLSIQGFKRFKEEFVVEFDQKHTMIEEDNGMGKTSVGDAITFAFTGRTLQGESRGRDLLNHDSDAILIVVDFSYGEEHYRLVRTMENGKTTITLNQQLMNQKELSEFISPDLFLILFNPLYFLGLDPTPARRTLSALLPTISKEMVFERLNEEEAAFLAKETFDLNDPATYLKNKREALKEFKQDLAHHEGYMDRAKQPIPIAPLPTNEQTEAFQKELQRLDEALKQNKEQQENLQKNSKEELLKQKQEVENRLKEVEQTQPQEFQQRLSLQHEIQMLRQEINHLNRPYHNADLQQAIQDFNVAHQTLVVQYQGSNQNVLRLQQELQQITQTPLDTTCPTCQQPVGQEKLQTMQQEWQKKVQQKERELKEAQRLLHDLTVQGQNNANNLAVAQQQLKEEQQGYQNQLNQQLQEKNQQIALKEEQLNTLLPVIQELEMRKKQALQKLQEQLQQLQQQIQNLHSMDREALNRLVQDGQQLEQQKNELNQAHSNLIAQHNVTKEQEAKRKEEYEKLVKADEHYRQSMNEMKFAIDAMKNFASTKVDILHDTISQYLDKVDVQLEEVVKSTGEIKDTFKMSYDSRPIQVCSLSERIKAGQEVSTMIGQLNQIELPMFVDNFESIQLLDLDYREQYIFAKVDQGNRENEAFQVVRLPKKEEVAPETEEALHSNQEEKQLESVSHETSNAPNEQEEAVITKVEEPTDLSNLESAQEQEESLASPVSKADYANHFLTEKEQAEIQQDLDDSLLLFTKEIEDMSTPSELELLDFQNSEPPIETDEDNIEPFSYQPSMF